MLEHLYEYPIVAVNDVKDLVQISYLAANNLVRKFVEQGVLPEITGQRRNRRFRYAEYIDLFNDA
ncbi:MAG: hypothetical protein WEA09_09355 [Gemmatimonadota bacterium]